MWHYLVKDLHWQYLLWNPPLIQLAFLKKDEKTLIDLVAVFMAPWNLYAQLRNSLPMFCAESHFWGQLKTKLDTKSKRPFLVHLYTSCFSHLPMKSCFICVLLFISKALWEEVWVWTWTHMEDNIVHVALGKNLKEYKPILAWAVWALKNSGGKTICVIHVHQPAKMIPMSKLSTFVRFIHMCTSA